MLSFLYDSVIVETKSFSCPSTNPNGITIANGDLITSDFSNNNIYIHEGVSSSTSSNFSGGGSNQRRLTFDGTNLISSDASGNVYIHSGVTSTRSSNFSTPNGGAALGLDYDGANLIIAEGSQISIMDGVSSAVSSSFSPPASDIRGIAYDGVNLISNDFVTGLIYIHEGKTDKIIQTYTSTVSITGMVCIGKYLVLIDNTNDNVSIR
jgi:hypothetical protein